MPSNLDINIEGRISRIDANVSYLVERAEEDRHNHQLLETRVRSLELFQAKVLGIAAVASAAVSAGVTWLVGLIKHS